MLEKSENFKDNVNLVVSNALSLQDEITDEQNGKGRKFTSRFIESGIAHYKEFGDVLITKETLDKFIKTMIGCPVIINHKDINDKNVDKERVGVISNVWYNENDGWYYCDGIIWDKDAISLVKNQGWNVSCSYDFKSDFESKTHNGKKIDMEFTDGNFLHLALVEVPRYERANIVINSVDNWVEPENIDYWFSTKTGVKIPVAKGQSKKDALSVFIKEKTTQRIERNRQKNEAIDILHHVVGKDLNYSKADLKRNIKKKNVSEKIYKIIEGNTDRLSDLTYKGKYFDTEMFNYGKSGHDETVKQEEFLNNLMYGLENDYFPQKDVEEEITDYYDGLGEYVANRVDELVNSYIDNGIDIPEDTLAEQLADIYGVEKEDIMQDQEKWDNFYSEYFKKLEVNNSIRKENVIMSALNELENFVRGIVENACKNEEKEEMKEELKVENEDKRKLIDEVAGMMKSAGCDDEIIRTAIKKMEKIGYEKSEDGTADNRCKNADKEEKEEKYEEEKEIAENGEVEVEEEEIDEEKLAENKKVSNSADEEVDNIDKARKLVYNGNSEIRSSYITRAERLELGNNY